MPTVVLDFQSLVALAKTGGVLYDKSRISGGRIQ